MAGVVDQEQNARSTAEFVCGQEFNERKQMEKDIIELANTGFYGTVDSVRALYKELCKQNGGVRPSKEEFNSAFVDLRGKSLEIRDRIIAEIDKKLAHCIKMINSLLDQLYNTVQEVKHLREENLRLKEQICNEEQARITAEGRANLAEEEIHRLALLDRTEFPTGEDNQIRFQ